MNIQFIGQIHSPFKDKFGTPRQSQIAKSTVTKIVLDKKVASSEMLDGLRVGTYLWVLFWFHLNVQKKKISKVRPPRLRGETRGVLATRSPHRPNPIGLSLGKIVKIQKHEIWLEGLDLVDETPVVDIKPYHPEFDRPQEKTKASWIDEHPFPQLEVKFNKDVFGKMASEEIAKLKTQLKEIISEDPRPLAYLNKPDHVYWIKYGKFDVGFEITNSIATVTQLKKVPGT